MPSNKLLLNIILMLFLSGGTASAGIYRVGWALWPPLEVLKPAEPIMLQVHTREEWNRVMSKQERKVDIRGRIATITPSNEDARGRGALGTLMIKSVRPDGTEDMTLITVTDDTLVFKQVGQTEEKAGFEDFKAGLQVEVTFKGPVLQSYPVQARAGEILIIDQASEERR